ncbi:glutamate-5-semialdehyde dehydrogenase [Marispirochaeta aestuarii]|uniref:glutamate-5-semialdehyde dehydrogenase n=1 Tax=Marispirochaeta aestuarii TaxID=1963862 RepID=UPI0029C79AAE|nr:glutamate-5-semialdehyde dehydrogenase [Marispirochaeta aestuarii]
MNNPKMYEAARHARKAAVDMAVLTGEQKNRALAGIMAVLQENAQTIFDANTRDIAQAQKDGVPAPLLKRLVFDAKKLDGVIDGIRALIDLDEPVGRLQLATELDEGLELHRISCPIGVIGMIFESRPDALVQISTLCLKSGNSVLLKGGREALETNRVLASCIAEGAAREGLPEGWIYNIESREEVAQMLSMDNEIDLLVPRGSKEFVRYIMDNSRIPVMGHADGICHTYIHASADPGIAVRVAVDGKAQYVAVCNATETILIDRSVVKIILPLLVNALERVGVRIKACAVCRELLPGLEEAVEEDWSTEYLDLIVSIKAVEGLEEAVDHINRYGSGHTDAIVSTDTAASDFFTSRVDSANVFVNCSTRFADGFRYGFGAEVGISTGKLHARGPVGLEGLLTYKYKLTGTGQIVADYASGKKHFTHRKLDIN